MHHSATELIEDPNKSEFFRYRIPSLGDRYPIGRKVEAMSAFLFGVFYVFWKGCSEDEITQFVRHMSETGMTLDNSIHAVAFLSRILKYTGDSRCFPSLFVRF